ncbi:putative protein serine/threonine kinase [Asimina triloba]
MKREVCGSPLALNASFPGTPSTGAACANTTRVAVLRALSAEHRAHCSLQSSLLESHNELKNKSRVIQQQINARLGPSCCCRRRLLQSYSLLKSFIEAASLLDFQALGSFFFSIREYLTMHLRWALRNLASKARFYGEVANGSVRYLSAASCNSPFFSRKPLDISKVLGGSETYWLGSHAFHDVRSVICVIQEPVDPFSLVADELSLLADRLREMVVAKVPKLASAAEYFFKMGVEGKRFRPTVLLLMASALNMPMTQSVVEGMLHTSSTELRARQQCIAEITEMIHVASLLHDDVLDDAETRRGIGSLNFVMGNKLAVLAGDFLLSRACVALASLKNTEFSHKKAHTYQDESDDSSHLISDGTIETDKKTYYKTASLISHSCKAIAILAGQTAEVSMLAYDYGRNLGLAFQLIDDVLDFTGTSTSLGKGSLSDIHHGIVTAPILFAMEEFPQLRRVVDRGFDNPSNIDLALDYLGKSRGIQRTKELAVDYANRAAAAIDSLPESDDEDVRISRRALVDLTHRVITRTK